MPTWNIHIKYARLLGLDVEICKKINEEIDFGYIAESLLKYYKINDMIHIHDFGRNRMKDFIIATKYLYEKYGSDAVKCFILHHMLDYLGYLATRKYDLNNIKRKLLERFLNLKEKIRGKIEKPLDNLVSDVIEKFLNYFSSNLNYIISDLVQEISLENAIYDRFKGIITKLCWFELLRRGIISRGFRVPYDVLNKLRSQVLKKFKKELPTIFKDINLYDIVNELNNLEPNIKGKGSIINILSKRNNQLCIGIKRLMILIENETNKMIKKQFDT